MNPWKLLRVDLSHRSWQVEELNENFLRKYLGGRTVGAYHLLREVPAEVDPLGPENKLIISTGLITRTKISGASRYSVIAKSPLTGGFGESEAGGWWGPELVAAGYHVIIIEGTSETPVYLWIDDGEVQILEAAEFWGSGNRDTYRWLREKHPRCRALQIGLAGENLVRYAHIVNEVRHINGRGGLGAVMGSKKLKAIAVRGTGEQEVADPEGLKAFRRWHTDLIRNSFYGKYFGDHGTTAGFEYQNVMGALPTRNFNMMTYDNIKDVSSKALEENHLKGHGTCYACALHCKPNNYLDDPEEELAELGGPEYETMSALGSLCGVKDIRTIVKANALATDLGLDSISLGNCIAFVMECTQNGIIFDRAQEEMNIQFGEDQVILELIPMIANREGIGDFLAEGVKRMSDKVGKGSEEFAMHVKGQEFPMHDPRTKLTQAIAYAVNPAGADHNTSPMDDMYSKKSNFLKLAAPLGILDPVPEQDFGLNKVRLYQRLSLERALYNSLMLCIFVGTPTLPVTLIKLTELTRIVTGWDISDFEMMKIAEKGITMGQLFTFRAGLGSNQNRLPRRMFQDVPSGPKVGRSVDEQALQRNISAYYQMMGWGEDACPTNAKLAELGLIEFIGSGEEE